MKAFLKKHFSYLLRLLISVLLFLAAFFVPLPFLTVLCFALSILCVGYKMLFHGVKHIFRLKFDENALMTIAIIAAFLVQEYPEAAAVAILFYIGEFLEDIAIDHSHKQFASINQIQPENARVLKDEKETLQDAKDVQIGDKIRIYPGDRIPLNCKVTKGSSSINTAALTGESAPLFAECGTELLSGYLNNEGILECEVTEKLQNSAASQIINLVFSSIQKKGKTEKWITKFSAIYTPIILIAAIFLLMIPTAFQLLSFHESLMRALVFLVTACPCALVISIPLSFFSAIGRLSKSGVLIKGTKYIETLANLKCVAFDKTGTLTTGTLKISSFDVKEGFPIEKALLYAATAEQFSTHPFSQAMREYTKNITPIANAKIKEFAGLGIQANVNHDLLLCGNQRLLNKYQITPKKSAAAYLCLNKEVIAYIDTEEKIPDAHYKLIKQLKTVNIEKAVMLTGDTKAAAVKVANDCGIEEFFYNLMPQEKVSHLEKLKKDYHPIAFIGDGINDAPVLAAADLGISMGVGSQIANSFSDITLVQNHLERLPFAISVAKRCKRIIEFNIIISLAIKLIIMILSIIGFANMWIGILADMGVTILAILNSLRIFTFHT